MAVFAVLLLATQLLMCKAFPSTQFRIVGCDDPEVEQAAAIAVDYMNANQKQGYKFALNRIDDVKVFAAGNFGEMFEVDLDLLETRCHVSNPTPLQNCPVRQMVEHPVESDCEVHMSKANGAFQVMNHICKTVAESAEDVTDVCPGCALLAPLNESSVVQAVDAALLKFNQVGNQAHLFKLAEVGRAKIQNFPAKSVILELAIVETNCPANTPNSVIADCAELTAIPAHRGFCNSVVSGDSVDIQCEIYNAQSAAIALTENKDTPVAVAVQTETPAVQDPAVPVQKSDATQQQQASVDAPADVIHKQVKRTLVAPEAAPGGVPTLPRCPGRIRFF
ncbi:alpha-2-HS-glycoprotein [Protopterus annectens]|uniref:alpha-2-HS-glycoprotein n=1 Tax=Protopterus annectens TaxID=7888 RepID=UPI001CF9F6D3|nr:alpha-2-HS-glycoprotein [Protopterus annectens]